MNIYTVLQKPILSEKADGYREEGKYTFAVRQDASKYDVRKAIETLYGVKVDKIAMQVRRLKRPRQGLKFSGKIGTVKRALVTVQPGSKLSIFDQ
jgi:large subunit ribosomal protein L23